MSLTTLLLIAVGLSADAFAVAVGKGLTMRRLHLRTAVLLGLAFGLAQALMPVIGWLLGSQLERYVTSVDHWIAFGLLALVGGTMLRDAVTGGDDDPAEPTPSASTGQPTTHVAPRELAVLAVATSIDALAVGISFALLEVSIVAAAVVIGVVTFVLSVAGVAIGQRAGARFRRPAAIAGGLVLIGIGVHILLDHGAL